MFKRIEAHSMCWVQRIEIDRPLRRECVGYCFGKIAVRVNKRKGIVPQHERF